MFQSIRFSPLLAGLVGYLGFLLVAALLALIAVGCAADDSGAKEAAAAAQSASSAAKDASMAAQNASAAAQQASAAAQEAVAAVSSATGDSSVAVEAAHKAASAAEAASTVAEAASAAARAASTAASEASTAAEGAAAAVSAQGSDSTMAVSNSKAAQAAAGEAAKAAQTAATAAQAAANAAKASDTSAATANSEAALTAANEAATAAAQAATAAVDAASAAQAAASSAKLAVDATISMNGADPGSLVIYSGRSESLVAPVIKQFKEATGVDVQVKYGGTSAMAATLQEEGKNSPTDVFWAQDPGALGALSPMFKPLPSDITLAVPEWARATDGSWVGVTGRARVIVYNSDLMDSELPESVEELTDPKWKGRVGWAPTNASFRVMVTAMRYIWGEDKTRDWLEGMLANDVRVYPKNTPIVDAAGNGEVDIGLVNHYYLHRFIAEYGDDFGARNLFLNDAGPASLVMVAGSGILKTSPNPENAELFLRFLLSQVAQQYFAASVYEYPLIEGVKTHRLIPPIDTLNGPEIDFALLDDLAGTEALLREVGAIP